MPHNVLVVVCLLEDLLRKISQLLLRVSVDKKSIIMILVPL